MIKLSKKLQKQQTFWKVESGGVLFTQHQLQGSPNAGGVKPRKIKAKKFGAPKGGGGACRSLLERSS